MLRIQGPRASDAGVKNILERNGAKKCYQSMAQLASNAKKYFRPYFLRRVETAETAELKCDTDHDDDSNRPMRPFPQTTDRALTGIGLVCVRNSSSKIQMGEYKLES
jgi:hypothetical protein